MEDSELFETAFYNWCIIHGIDIYVKGSDLASMSSSKGERKITAEIDLVKLKAGIEGLIERKTQEVGRTAIGDHEDYCEARYGDSECICGYEFRVKRLQKKGYKI